MAVSETNVDWGHSIGHYVLLAVRIFVEVRSKTFPESGIDLLQAVVFCNLESLMLLALFNFL